MSNESSSLSDHCHWQPVASGQERQPLGHCCVKYCIFVTSFPFWALTSIATGVAAWHFIGSAVGHSYGTGWQPYLVLLGVALFTLIVSILACTGSIGERPCCLRCFPVCLAPLVLCQLAALCLLLSCRLSDSLRVRLLPWQRRALSTAPPRLTDALGRLLGNGKNNNNSSAAVDSAADWLVSNAWPVAMVTLACLVAQLASACAACWLAGRIATRRRRQRLPAAASASGAQPLQLSRRTVGPERGRIGGYTDYYTLI